MSHASLRPGPPGGPSSRASAPGRAARGASPRAARAAPCCTAGGTQARVLTRRARRDAERRAALRSAELDRLAELSLATDTKALELLYARRIAHRQHAATRCAHAPSGSLSGGRLQAPRLLACCGSGRRHEGGMPLRRGCRLPSSHRASHGGWSCVPPVAGTCTPRRARSSTGCPPRPAPPPTTSWTSS